jgi:hypothetical protein
MNLLFMGFSFFYLLKIAKISQDCRFYQGFLFECLYKLSRFGVKRVSGTSVAERNPAEPPKVEKARSGAKMRNREISSRGTEKSRTNRKVSQGDCIRITKAEIIKRGSGMHGKRSRRGSERLWA